MEKPGEGAENVCVCGKERESMPNCRSYNSVFVWQREAKCTLNMQAKFQACTEFIELPKISYKQGSLISLRSPHTLSSVQSPQTHNWT